MTTPIPENPWLSLGDMPSPRAAAVSTPTPGAAAAIQYPCCPDCGVREPCDRHCPHVVVLEHDLHVITNSFEIEPVPAFLLDGRKVEPGRAYQVDEIGEIETLLELARAEEWPAPPRRMVG